MHINCKGRYLSLNFGVVKYMNDGECVTNMCSGILYLLRSKNPVIDAVGICEERKDGKSKQWKSLQ